MSITSDFFPYVDGNGLLCPNPVPPGTIRGSDNGTCFTSEFLLELIPQETSVPPGTASTYFAAIQRCVNSSGYLTRAPGDTTLGNPDDHYGVYAALVAYDMPPFFKFYWQLLRMPQLFFASRCAEGAPKWYKPYYWPLAIITAVIIGVSNINDSTSDSNSRRLAYLLTVATIPYSFLCRLATKVWTKRLLKDYPNGMKDVYGVYFQPNGIGNNPYSKWAP
jgi:hypothetical protein